MTDLGRILETIEGARRAREAGDIDALAALLAPGASYRLVSGSSLIPTDFTGPRDAKQALDEMIHQFTFRSFEATQILVEADRAAIRLRVTTPDGEDGLIETEIASFWTFDEVGRITEIVDFVDTALVARMMGVI